MTPKWNYLAVLKYIICKVIPLFDRLDFIADCGLRIADFLLPKALAEAIRNPQ